MLFVPACHVLAGEIRVTPNKKTSPASTGSIPPAHTTRKNSRPKIGIALSGGGAIGLAHIGVLRVLEEYGIPIDYVAGNSMGAVVGALYSIGYTPDEIEEAVTGTDWMRLFAEKQDRRSLPADEKNRGYRHLARFTIEGGKAAFMPGLLSGQKIHRFFSRLAWPGLLVEDFMKLPRSFSCVATDLETGEPIVLSRGFLPDAMRASMSIPGVFAPYSIDGKLLVDGLFSRDFPVEDVINMGADIIIGVNTGFQLLPADSIKTIFNIISQSMNLNMLPARRKQAALCDILIAPVLDDYTVISFNKADEIIEAGEKGAREIADRLRTLADSLHRWEYTPPKMPRSLTGAIDINDIKINGAVKIPADRIRASLGIDPPAQVTALSVEKIIDRLYGSGFFEFVSYHFKQSAAGTCLVIDVKEDNRNFLSIGLQYDTTWMTSLLLNAVLHDPFRTGTKLDIDLLLGRRIRMNSTLSLRSGFENILSFRAGTDYIYDFINIYDGEDLVRRLDVHNIRTSIGTGISLSRFFSWYMDMTSEWSWTSPHIAEKNYEKEWNRLIFVSSSLLFDNLDRTWFPRKGMMLCANNQIAGSGLGNNTSFNRLSGRLVLRIPLHPRLSLGGRFMLGSARGGDLPVQYRYFVGGVYSPFNFFATRETNFYGYRHQEFSGRHALVAGMDLQLQIMRYMYLILHGNAGNTTEQWNRLFRDKDLAYGTGLTLGMDTPAGPVEVSLAHSSRHPVIFFLSAGYRF